MASPEFIPGNIQYHIEQWEKLTSDQRVLECVSGYKIDFLSEPVQNCMPRQYHLSQEQGEIVETQISDLLYKGVITEIPIYDVNFVSNVFIRPKPNGKHRMIIDLSDLNEFIRKEHFKMDNLDVALDLVYKGCWFTSIDLQDAYYTVPIFEPHQSYLAFMWEQKMYKFQVLPFGLTSAPRVFTKLLKPIFSNMRGEGISCLGYIDDCLIISSTEKFAHSDSDSLYEVLANLGFKINEVKSSLKPSTEIIFLGYIIDSISMTVRPTDEKIEKAIRRITKLLNSNTLIIREVAEVIGFLVDLCKGVEYGKRHYREIEKDKIFSLRRAGEEGFNGSMRLTFKAKQDLNWWLDNLNQSSKKIRIQAPKITLTTDASEEGWGAVENHKKTGGRWSHEEKGDHINVLELRAVLLGLKSFHSQDRYSEILIKTDNTTTVSYINKMGGTKSKECNAVACEIWDFCEARKIWLVATHIPGDENIEADYESRHFSDDTEWELTESIFNKICELWGYPSIDLFASRLNHKTPQYISWHYDPGAWAVNAFTVDWSEFHLPYIFPPFRLVGRCVQKVKADGASAIIVAPRWQGQAWFSQLLRGAKTPPLYLRGDRINLNPVVEHLQESPIRKIPLVAVLY